MKCYITSIGEPTTQLCYELLKFRFDTVLIEDRNTTLQEKLKFIYNDANEDFIRVDADVIPNKNLTDFIQHLANRETWWLQFLTYDWFKQDVTNGGVQFIKREAIPYLRMNIDAADSNRPESYMFRLPEFHEPRRCQSHPMVMGLHGYKGDIERVKKVKASRNQLDNYDFILAEKINEL